MKDCKYRLPCGRCDKYNTDCDAHQEKFYEKSDINDVVEDIKSYVECNHEWLLCGTSTSGNSYICAKCGARQTVPPKGLLS